MARFPSASAYQEALQHPDDAFVHPDLRGATIAETLLGAPRAYSGARAAVFPIDLPAGKFALKCFVGHQPDVARRYREISRFADRADVASIEPGTWLDDAVDVDGNVVPALLTRWVDGRSLNAFVAANLDSPAMLADLAATWLDLCRDIDAIEMAHGDLQHGNVLVTQENGQCGIHLIDFDGAYVPTVRRLGPLDAGHRHYQHPDRGRGDFSAFVDRFSTIVIYVALRAVACQPDLWARFDTSENMLFTANDFLEPGSSRLFAELRSIPDVADISEALRMCCLVRPADVPPLSEIVEQGFRPGAQLLLRKAVPGAASGRRLAVPLLLVFSLVLALVIGASVLGGVLETGLLVIGLLLVIPVIAAAVAFFRTPEERRIRRLSEQVRYARSTIASIQSERAQIERDRDQYISRRESMASERLDRLRQEAMDRALRHHFVQEVAAEGYASHKVVIRMKRSGMRTAADVRDDELSRVTQVGDGSVEAIRRWRRDLEQQYSDLVPFALSAAEQRRLERQIHHRVEGFERDIRRLGERGAMQRRILAELEERQPERVAVRFRTFVRSLIPRSSDHRV